MAVAQQASARQAQFTIAIVLSTLLGIPMRLLSRLKAAANLDLVRARRRAKFRLEFADSFAGAMNQEFAHQMAVSQGLMERIIGGGFMLVIGIIMLGFLFDLDLVGNFSGPFADQLNTVETVLGAAIVFAVLGILALAGVYAYSMFRSGR